MMSLANFVVAVFAALLVAGSVSAGVLIGQLPDKGGADIRDIRWTIEEDNVRFVLVIAGSDGKMVEHRLNPVPVSIARQALRYAADGRPLTVTMIKADPLPDLKILLHPALVDSSLGRKAIRLDQLVDEFAGGRSLIERGQIDTRVHSQDALYKLAWASRVKPVLELQKEFAKGMDDEKVRKQLDEEIRALASLADRYLADKELRRQAEVALGQIDLLKADGSFLRAKREYYDATLVDLLRTHNKNSELDVTLASVPALVTTEINEIKQFERTSAEFNRDIRDFNAKVRALEADIKEYNADVRRHNNGIRGGRGGLGGLDDLPRMGHDRNKELEDMLRRLKQRGTDPDDPPLFPRDIGLGGRGDIGGFPKRDKVDETSLTQREKNLESRQTEINRDDTRLKRREKNLQSESESTAKTTKKLLTQTLSPPPEFTVWSGVRERNFAGDAADYLMPESPEQMFRFMVQVAFTTPPTFLEGEASADYSDETPYEYVEIEEKVNRKVTEGLEKDVDAARAVEEMATFTQLQRLFRAAIAGKIGERFPNERLADLALALGSGDTAREYARTLRWLPRPGGVELSGMFKIALAVGVSDADVEALRSPFANEEGLKVRLHEITMNRLDLMEKSENVAEQKAATAMRQCFQLLEENLSNRENLGIKLLSIGKSEQDLVPRMQAWDAFMAEQDIWLDRWEKAAALEVDQSPPPPLKKAANTLAHIDYCIQARNRMRVIDDERASDLDRVIGRQR